MAKGKLATYCKDTDAMRAGFDVANMYWDPPGTQRQDISRLLNDLLSMWFAWKHGVGSRNGQINIFNQEIVVFQSLNTYFKNKVTSVIEANDGVKPMLKKGIDKAMVINSYFWTAEVLAIIRFFLYNTLYA